MAASDKRGISLYCSVTCCLCVALCGCHATGHSYSGPTSQEAIRTEDAVERELAQQTKSIHKRLAAAGALYEDPSVTARASEILSKLSFTINGTQPRIYVIRDPRVNAFVLYDGTMCLNSGLIAKLSHPDQLAFILSHEAAHWSQQHARIRYRTTANTVLVAQVLDTIVTPIASRFRLKGVAEEGIDKASVASYGLYSRELEHEADKVGLAMVVAAGFDPQHALIALEIFKRRGESSLGFEASLLSDHPGVQERIDALRATVEAARKQLPEQPREVDPAFIQQTAQIRLANAEWAAREGSFYDALDDIELVERVFPTRAKSIDWNRAQFVRGKVYRAMARDVRFVKMMLSEQYWKRMHGDLSDEEVSAKWCHDAQIHLQRIERPRALLRAAKRQLLEMRCNANT
jgi:predicted Zn-dependent protease